MKNLLLLAVISAAVIINSGCSSKLMSFEKRKYNKGYHVDFAAKKDKRKSVALTEPTVTLPQQEVKELTASAITETVYAPLPELTVVTDFTPEPKETALATTKVEKKKFFQNPILKHFTKEQLKKTTKGFQKVMPHKNTASVSQTMGTSFFTILGVLIAGGSLVALVVMLFSSWASTTLLIAFISGILLGLVLLIVGANS